MTSVYTMAQTWCHGW